MRRSTREIVVAALAVAAVLVVTGVLLWVLKPADDEATPTTPISVPTTPATVPGAAPDTTAPAGG
ncbi:MAG: hypothetical protein WEC34_07850 [Acidimicrobiia bacterium]